MRPVAAALCLAVGAVGCGSDGASPGGPAGPSDEAARAARAACEFPAGTLSTATLGASAPKPSTMPIDHVVIVMMENRSFDHYLSQLPAYGQPDVDVADASFTNPDLTGANVAFHPTNRYCVEDPDHGWRGSHEQWADGENSGFVLTNEPDGARAMGWLGPSDLPFYYELANTFSISDRHFCSVLGPTWPNRLFLAAGQSFRLTRNTIPAVEQADANVFAELTRAGIEWTEYRDNLATVAMFLETMFEGTVGCRTGDGPCRVRPMTAFFEDAAAGRLPPVSLVSPEMVTGIYEKSEHPPGNAQLGQHFVWSVVDALGKSPLWSRLALFITYDEHGGFADHVPPPPACHPGTGDPDDTTHGTFDRFGFRVPLYVVSPWVKPHYVTHEVTDHTSILRFVQHRFGLPALTRRDANASALLDVFDFERMSFPTAPVFAEPPVSAEGMARCEEDFPGGG